MPKYVISPLEHGIATEHPSSQIPGTFSPWMVNVKVEQHSLKKRWGYALDRNLGTGRPVYSIVLFKNSGGTQYTLYLTDMDLIQRCTGSGKTWKYLTDTYTQGSITNITGAVVTGSGTSWSTNPSTYVGSWVMPGDKFILDSDHVADEEPSPYWATIQSVDSDTQLTLTSNYTGAGTTGTYKARKIFSSEANKRWVYAILNDKFIFSNSLTNVQQWTGSGYCYDLEMPSGGYVSTPSAGKAQRACYLIEFAERLFIANILDSGSQNPYLVRWSGNGDPTYWTVPSGDLTEMGEGEMQLMETEDHITGLGKVGSNLIIYKRDNIYIYSRTGEIDNPIEKTADRPGNGLVAPYSLVDVMGSQAWLGRNDFYFLNGDQPVMMSKNKMRFMVFDVVSDTEIENVWGFNNIFESEVIWTANTLGGKYQFVWNYTNDEWYPYQYSHDIVGAGRGII